MKAVFDGAVLMDAAKPRAPPPAVVDDDED